MEGGTAVERMPKKDDCVWTHPPFLTPLMHIMGAAMFAQGPAPPGWAGCEMWLGSQKGRGWFGSAMCTGACKGGLRTRGIVQASVPQFPQACCRPTTTKASQLGFGRWRLAGTKEVERLGGLQAPKVWLLSCSSDTTGLSSFQERGWGWGDL